MNQTNFEWSCWHRFLCEAYSPNLSPSIDDCVGVSVSGPKLKVQVKVEPDSKETIPKVDKNLIKPNENYLELILYPLLTLADKIFPL